MFYESFLGKFSCPLASKYFAYKLITTLQNLTFSYYSNFKDEPNVVVHDLSYMGHMVILDLIFRLYVK